MKSGFVLKTGDRVLFCGDSVTRRTATTEGVPHDRLITYMDSWVPVVEMMIAAAYPSLRLAFYNRAIGGSTIHDVHSMLEANIRESNPSWISLMIGLNDSWKSPAIDAYKQGIRDFIRRCREGNVPNIILMTPTINGSKREEASNRILQRYADAVRKISQEEGVYLVDVHKAFWRFLKETEAGLQLPLTVDGVHMNPVGNQLIAHTWLKSLGFEL